MFVLLPAGPATGSTLSRRLDIRDRSLAACSAEAPAVFFYVHGGAPLLVASRHLLGWSASGQLGSVQLRVVARARRRAEALLRRAAEIPCALGVPRALPLERVALVLWIRSELRLDDNDLLRPAVPHACAVPFFCAGADSALMTAAADLRARLREIGSELVVRFGSAAEALAELCGVLLASGYSVRVECATRGHPAEQREEEGVRDSLRRAGASLACRVVDSVYPLATAVQGTMASFSSFREAALRGAIAPREPRAGTPRLRPLPGVVGKGVPLGDLPRPAAAPLGESETSALARLAACSVGDPCPLGSGTCPAHHAAGCVCPSFTEALRIGCISPRLLHARLPSLPPAVAPWLRLQLLWRDHTLLLHAGSGSGAGGGGGGGSA